MQTASPQSPVLDPFGGIARLYGKAGFARLQNAHVAVIGVGGVGSWTVEALARSGVGQLTLVDFDEICVSNLNRQLPATHETVGQAKVEILAARVATINPACQVRVERRFFSAKSAEALFALGFDVVIDAIDAMDAKVLLLVTARAHDVFTVTSGAAGGKRDLTQVEVADLVKAHHDPLLSRLRKRLRQEHNWSRNTRRKWGIPAVFSPEPVMFPTADGEACATRAEASPELNLNCNTGFGTVSFVTGAFGFALAQAAIEHLAKEDR